MLLWGRHSELCDQTPLHSGRGAVWWPSLTCAECLSRLGRGHGVRACGERRRRVLHGEMVRVMTGEAWKWECDRVSLINNSKERSESNSFLDGICDAQHSFRSDVYLASINPGLRPHNVICLAKYWTLIDPQKSNQKCIFTFGAVT